MMLYLPPGTKPHDEYAKTLNDLIQEIEKARQAADAAEKAIEWLKIADESAIKSTQYSGLRGENMARQTEAFKQRVNRPKVLQSELYTHLTKFKPINAKAFFDKMDALINERMSILAELHFDAVKLMDEPK
jgi:hypothetical protein